jgi:hypothetical protein
LSVRFKIGLRCSLNRLRGGKFEGVARSVHRMHLDDQCGLTTIHNN